MYLVNLLCMAALLHMSILCCCKLSKHSAGGTGLKAQSLLRLFSLDSSGRLLRANIVHLRLTIGYLKATVVYIRVTLGHPRVTIGHPMVTIGYFFLSFTLK